ncbi:MAG TPA: squalene--hopene cyclase [Steroidobacteraceae bacterium]|jgi:squalene-hopene/tetraprenyl-beta-curcumene cyclase|nr:squalene--hopene cyclase [Steroidobacteraceae bacterium]
MAVERALDAAVPGGSGASELSLAAERAREALLSLQQADGHWWFELEADCTIPAELILMMHFLDEIEDTLVAKLAVYLREHQAQHGGWPLYQGGEFDLSCSVKAYYALKLAGDSPDAPHMQRARAAILERGGAAHANVFTRILLATFEQVPWRAVPYIPVEIMLLPRWFPFHLEKVSYWSRTVMVPLLILCTLKARAQNPRAVGIRELFAVAPEQERHYFRRRGAINRLFLAFDRLGRIIDPLIPRLMRARALRLAEQWINERLNGEDGLGAIFPAMVNALEVMVLLGYANDDPRRVTAKRAIYKLVVTTEHSAHCQPCLSPVWDTALAALALHEEGAPAGRSAMRRGLSWLRPLQITADYGDWRVRRPHLHGGGWAFQYGNGHYPDLDDTAVVVWALHAGRAQDAAASPATLASIAASGAVTSIAGRSGATASKDPAIEAALDWLSGMQSRNGGFAAFDVDNTYYYLNEIPFADHGALLDPPTADVTARVITALALVGRAQDRGALERAVAYLRATQEPSGAWFGRWGTNYIYGTWSVLVAFAAAGIGPEDPAVARAIDWLKSCQHPDGGWGESNDSYGDPALAGAGLGSTPYQSAWALLGLMAMGCRDGAVSAGIDYLLRSQRADGLWQHESFTAPGFPRVFYLKYHGYCAYFPLWALARYRRLQDRPAARNRSVDR